MMASGIRQKLPRIQTESTSRLAGFWDETLSFLLYALLIALTNAAFAAPPVNVDNNYKDALNLFEQRDIVSRQKAIHILERNLETNAEHQETQALIAFLYAHEAYLLQQLGERSNDYLTSAEAFAKAVLAKQPTNSFARKTVIYLHLIGGLHQDATKLMEKAMTEKETDPDMWYIQAVLSEGDKARKSLAKALELKPNHVWIYSDMVFRAIRLNEIPLAEKWIAALEARLPGIADIDLLRAVIASLKKDRKAAESHWGAFSNKAPDSPILAHLMNKNSKNKTSP